MFIMMIDYFFKFRQASSAHYVARFNHTLESQEIVFLSIRFSFVMANHIKLLTYFMFMSYTLKNKKLKIITGCTSARLMHFKLSYKYIAKRI